MGSAKGGGRPGLLVSVPTIKRRLKRRGESGGVEPKPSPDRPSRKGALLEGWLPKHLEENDDLILQQHREAFEEEFGQKVSTSTIERAIADLPNGGWPIKKVSCSPRARGGGKGALAPGGSFS